MSRTVIAGILPLLLLAGVAWAAPDSLVLKTATDRVDPGETAEIQVFARVYPEGRALVPVRCADVTMNVRGDGTVEPRSGDAGETRWIYRAPAGRRKGQDGTIVARLRTDPESAGSIEIRTRKADPEPAAPPPPSALQEDDQDGEVVDGVEGATAPGHGRLVTVEKWRVRQTGDQDWSEKQVPARGEPFYAPAPIHQLKFRVNEAGIRSVEVQWWRSDRTKEVRRFSEKNRRLATEKDQDGFLHVTFQKMLPRTRDDYTFSVVVTTADGRTLRENILVNREKAPKNGGGKGKGKGR